MRLQEIQFI